MERELQERRDLESDLRLAIRHGELELRFQPIVDLKTQLIVNCEALARWRHPRHGFIRPSMFIPIAEETGLIGEIGEWVIGRPVAAARPGRTASGSRSISPLSVRSHRPCRNRPQRLAGVRAAGRRVELEITESVLLRDNEQVLRILEGLKALGTRIALDDFGTGYSSLGYLQRFPIDKIKIDQSFVRQMTLKPECVLIVESIGALAKKLGLTTTAEGIETADHADLIRTMGYVEGQGYYFHRPLTAEECHRRVWAQESGIPSAVKLAS